MRARIAMGAACAGITVMLALSACSDDTDPNRSATPTGSASPTSSGSLDPDPDVRVTPSLPPGIPTAAPSHGPEPDSQKLEATASVTLATRDPDSGGLLVGGFVSGVVEDGGDCEYVVTPVSGDPIHAHTDGVENNGTTSCGSTVIPKSSLHSGKYAVVLKYSDSRGTVESEPVEVTMP